MKKIIIQNKKLFGFMVVFVAILFIVSFYISSFTNLKNLTLNITSSNNLENDIEKWTTSINNLKIFPDSKNASFVKNPKLNAIDGYVNNVENINKFNLIKLPIVKMIDGKETEKIIASNLQTTDNNFLINEKYSKVIGPIKFGRSYVFKLQIEDKITDNISIDIFINDLEKYTTYLKGGLDNQDMLNQVNSNFSTLITSIKENNQPKILEYILTDNSTNQLKPILAIENLASKLSSLSYTSFEKNVNDQNDYVEIGNVIYNQKNSQFSTKIPVIYDKNTKTYKFNNVFETFSKLLNPVVVKVSSGGSSTSEQINCTDCFLAPVDKTHALPSKYIPSLVGVSVSGGGQLTSDTNTALNKLVADAKSNGINITLISSYRSYQTQISTFNYWVSQQKKKGLNQAQAEEAANRISARAGHSEHQLGTTADLKCTGCGDFDNSKNNLKLYEYLEKNAHRFGFVISYPKDKEAITGYSHEPWHIRYIGEDLATLFYNRGYLTNQGDYSTKFLAQMNLF